MKSFNVAMNVNGNVREVAVDTHTLLIDVIRSTFGLTGTKLGCGSGDCGACSAILNGSLVSSCLVYAMECDGAEVLTIEHVAQTPIGKMIVDELIANDGSQCGFCTPGIVVTASHLLEAQGEKASSDSEIKTALAGNLCRCTGYFPIKRSIQSVAEKLVAGNAQ